MKKTFYPKYYEIHKSPKLMCICKEQKHQRLWGIPRFKTSAGLEPDISSASTVANADE